MKMNKLTVAGAAAIAVLAMAPLAASAGMYVKDPVGLFSGNGRYWMPRHGNGSGVIRLNRDGSVIMVWNKMPYRGTWKQTGDRITTMWDNGAPFKAPSWRVHKNADPKKQYTATSSKP